MVSGLKAGRICVLLTATVFKDGAIGIQEWFAGSPTRGTQLGCMVDASSNYE